MDTSTSNETTSTVMIENDDYDEPIWKSKTNRFSKQASYSRKNQDKFLDKNLATRNRELYLDLFDQDPNATVCDKEQFEKELFSDIKDSNSEVKPAKRKYTKKKKAIDNENPEFLTIEYQRNLEKMKIQLQENFKKTSTYRDLIALKNIPLNIKTCDSKGNTVRHLKYYYDYETNKREFVEVKNDEDNDFSESDEDNSSKRKLANKQTNNSIDNDDEDNQKLKRKRITKSSANKEKTTKQQIDKKQIKKQTEIKNTKIVNKT